MVEMDFEIGHHCSDLEKWSFAIWQEAPEFQSSECVKAMLEAIDDDLRNLTRPLKIIKWKMIM